MTASITNYTSYYNKKIINQTDYTIKVGFATGKIFSTFLKKAEKEVALQDKNSKLNLATVELEEMQSEFENILEDKNSLILEKEELEKEVMPIKELQK